MLAEKAARGSPLTTASLTQRLGIAAALDLQFPRRHGSRDIDRQKQLHINFDLVAESR